MVNTCVSGEVLQNTFDFFVGGGGLDQSTRTIGVNFSRNVVGGIIGGLKKCNAGSMQFYTLGSIT